MPMGMADVATVLFSRYINIDPTAPDWPDRDRFVLSAGHGSMLQYSLHYLLGYEDMPIEELQRFRQLGSRTAGHPEHGHTLGIETTTGPLGQGISTAVGMALAERMLAARPEVVLGVGPIFRAQTGPGIPFVLPLQENTGRSFVRRNVPSDGLRLGRHSPGCRLCACPSASRLGTGD